MGENTKHVEQVINLFGEITELVDHTGYEDQAHVEMTSAILTLAVVISQNFSKFLESAK